MINFFNEFVGLLIVYRLGYCEEDVVDYDMCNFKVFGFVYICINFKLKEEFFEFVFGMSYGWGIIVYQGDNCFSFCNI